MQKKEENFKDRLLLAGIDVGSTTTKMAVLRPETHEVVFSYYGRHHADQAGSVGAVLEKAREALGNVSVSAAMTGSGAKPIADALGLPFIQEVVANSIALKENFPAVRTAIELGGQDAKMIFFECDEGGLRVGDMRMNGSCAGGTGAFIDEIASILKSPVEEFDALAAAGTCVYDISGRCGVYAKTDIQPLLNQGVAKQDLALSAFHAIAKQTIGGLAQGLDIHKPVAFEGGPLSFNPMLVKVFCERLGLSDEDVIRPQNPELMMARGAAISLETMFAGAREFRLEEIAGRLHTLLEKKAAHQEAKRGGFFSDPEEYEAFKKRHALGSIKAAQPVNGRLDAWLGIDSGSTTIKFVLMDKDEAVIDSFYAPNEGEPLRVAKDALLAMRDKFLTKGIELNIVATSSTGYGEMLFNKAFSTESHLVETVAHAGAAAKYAEDATFLLDIGGQDMKAIWLDHGVITNIVVNEACSSGCGSFLANFASTLGIRADEIAGAAFSSENPACLGSRCTVFMNSSIITEQRNGRLPEDIMAGLCRSIIENVFTKVIRLSNVDQLGDKIIVQGGTFLNDAVLRAMEQYVGREVIRSPYPGLMGAIGAALDAKEKSMASAFKATFIGFEGLENFSFTQRANVPCPYCGNHCRRTVMAFSNGNTWITNNRCENGEVLEEPGTKHKAPARVAAAKKVPNLFKERERLLFADYPFPAPAKRRDLVIGIPRVLMFWDTLPFWRTFWRALGFTVRLSAPSSQKLYESGISAVTSDTVCYPAKLVHGHIRDLAKAGVDVIFMPSVAVMPTENTEETSVSVCAVVKGYPLVLKNSDNPEVKWGVKLDAPLYYWYSPKDREKQICAHMQEAYGIGAGEVRSAVRAGEAAQRAFKEKLCEQGRRVLEEVKREGSFAVVLASRPYQNDKMVNHGIADIIAGFGIPVLTADSLEDLNKTDLKSSRLDIVNNFHARMLEGALMAAKDENLEYVQIVSFGCGHDAYLSDEIVRLMRETSGKAPLILKVDETDARGALNIRLRSFLETVARRRKKGAAEGAVASRLTDPYAVKFTKQDRKDKIVLVPNTSHAFCQVLSAALRNQGIRAVPLEVGREEAIRYGKQYVHNDICFPAQVVVGEAIGALKSGRFDPKQVAIGMGKYVGDCRLTHYGALLRKALDDAGFPFVPILTNDDEDSHDLHPGFRLNLASSAGVAFALPMIDALEELLRKIRPYETVKGSSEKAFASAMAFIEEALAGKGVAGLPGAFKKGIALMSQVGYDRSRPRPRVLIVGEYLLNFHPGANHDIEAYLEENGFEIIEARMTDVIRKTYFCQKEQVKEFGATRKFRQKTWFAAADEIFELAHSMADRIASLHPLYKKPARLEELADLSDPVIPKSFDAGEGILIPAEILHHAKEGCRAFVILQPFGCLPNHIVGRGITKKLKELYPDAQILPLDYDPDVSFANIENRLQMLIMNVKQAALGGASQTGERERADVKRTGKARLGQPKFS